MDPKNFRASATPASPSVPHWLTPVLEPLLTNWLGNGDSELGMANV